MIQVKVKGEAVEVPKGGTARDLAIKLKLTGPHQALGASINGVNRDLVHPLEDGDEIIFWNFDDPEGKEIFWHTSAHVLAQAVLRLWPDAQPTIGPPIENGFYYDFGNLTISDADFARIEEEMRAIVKENFRSEREVFSSKEAALDQFRDNQYKVELIEGLEEGKELSGYRQGEFFDLCRGPHLPNTGKIKALKVTKTSGAYWRADQEREMLTRIYGITFPDRDQLKTYLKNLEEAKKRDHKVIGPKLDLYSMSEEAPGMPFIHPKGLYIWNQLIDYWRELHQEAGYVEIKTPMMMGQELWEKSGHWYNYRQNMYTTEIDERHYAIKPMNCPGCMLYYKTHQHSYREFPLKVGEIGHVHRYEAHGALSGLFRVRGFHQDDAHIFITPRQLQDEIVNVLDLSHRLYSTFGLEYHLELSTRPEEGTIGTDEDWEFAEERLKRALDDTGREYKINPGDGSFYGPKIDSHLRDAIGRTWQCGTVQLDMALPEKFNLEYTDKEGMRSRPIMLHRTIYGSLERFLGGLIEMYMGKFPLWLSPRQIRILTIADRHIPYADELARKFREEHFQVEVDDSAESMGKKVRNAQLDQVNYMITVGDAEVENQTLALRTRDNVRHGELEYKTFIQQIAVERKTKSLTSAFANDQD